MKNKMTKKMLSLIAAGMVLASYVLAHACVCPEWVQCGDDAIILDFTCANGANESVLADRIWADYWIVYFDADPGTGVLVPTGAPMCYDFCSAVYSYTSPCTGETEYCTIDYAKSRRCAAAAGCDLLYPEAYLCNPTGGEKPDPGPRPY